LRPGQREYLDDHSVIRAVGNNLAVRFESPLRTNTWSAAAIFLEGIGCYLAARGDGFRAPDGLAAQKIMDVAIDQIGLLVNHPV